MGDNATKFRIGSQSIADAAVPEQLPDLSVFNGHAVVIKSRATNTGYVYIGHTSATAQAHHFELSPGESIEVYTDNLNDIWVDVATNGDYVEWIAEVPYGEA